MSNTNSDPTSPRPTDSSDEVIVMPTGGRDGDVVNDPASLIRIGTMVQALREEIKGISLDEAGRQRLAEVHRRTVDAVKEALSDDLREELSEFALPLPDGIPTTSELQIAQALLAGWLEGLFRGIQAAVFTQQAAAQRQLRELKGGPPDEPGRGQYL